MVGQSTWTSQRDRDQPLLESHYKCRLVVEGNEAVPDPVILLQSRIFYIFSTNVNQPP
ncbi:hypothetical protein J6590_057303 [Homalodisca vitripennis]|nr:hypothetical protein J6590_057303 [Homalodisca vitripennis]